jgi:hypothetical protein
MLVFITSCNSQNNETGEAEELSNKTIHDSLAATGTHGYYTTTFIIGRLKTMPIPQNSLPFETKVLKIAPELLEKSINFQILDFANYKIAYTNNSKKQAILKGVFNQKLENEKIQVVISKSDFFSHSTPSTIESFKMINYLLKVHSY